MHMMTDTEKAATKNCNGGAEHHVMQQRLKSFKDNSKICPFLFSHVLHYNS